MLLLLLVFSAVFVVLDYLLSLETLRQIPIHNDLLLGQEEEVSSLSLSNFAHILRFLKASLGTGTM